MIKAALMFLLGACFGAGLLWLFADTSTAPLPAPQPLTAPPTPIPQETFVHIESVLEVATQDPVHPLITTIVESTSLTANELESRINDVISQAHPYSVMLSDEVNILLDRLILIDPDRALNILGRSHTHAYSTGRLLNNWIQNHPTRAAHYYLDNKTRYDRQLGALLLNHPEIQQGGLFEIVKQRYGPEADDHFQLGQLYTQLQDQSPTEAFNTLQSMPDDQRTNLYWTLVSRWPHDQLDNLANLASQLTDAKHREAIFSNIFTTQLANNPEKAIELVQTYAPDDSEILGSAMRLLLGSGSPDGLPRLRQYADETGDYEILIEYMSYPALSVKESMEVIESLPAAHQDEAYQRIVHKHIAEDPQGALEWALSLDGDKWAIADGYYRRIAGLDIAEGLLSTLSDERARVAIGLHMVREMYEDDKESAIAFGRLHDLPEDQLEKMETQRERIQRLRREAREAKARE